MILETFIFVLDTDKTKIYKAIYKNLDDLGSIYTKLDTLEKRELVNMVFDSKLYYENGAYRTTYMAEIFSDNTLKMKELNLLYYQKKRDFKKKSRQVGVRGFEPPTSWSQTRRDNRATLHPDELKKKRRDRDSNPGDSFPSTD